MPSDARIALITCGTIITPLSATDSATSAISSGVTATSPWPIAASAKNGWLRANVPSSGPTLLAAAGERSIGGAGALIPNAVMPCASRSPRLRPIRAKVVLHEWVKLSVTVPPQFSPPKLDNVRFDSGRRDIGDARERSRRRHDAGVERDRGREHLERRSGRIALAVGAGEVGMVRELLEEGEVLLDPDRVVTRKGSRVERRIRVHRDDAAGLHVEHDHRAPPVAQRVLRGLLRGLRQREHDGAGRVAGVEEVGEAPGLEAERRGRAARSRTRSRRRCSRA